MGANRLSQREVDRRAAEGMRNRAGDAGDVELDRAFRQSSSGEGSASLGGGSVAGKFLEDEYNKRQKTLADTREKLLGKRTNTIFAGASASAKTLLGA